MKSSPASTLFLLFLITGLLFTLSKIYTGGTVERFLSFFLLLWSFGLWMIVAMNISSAIQNLTSGGQGLLKSDLSSEHALLVVTILGSLITTGFFVFSLYLISGFFNLTLVEILVGVCLSGIILSGILREFLEVPSGCDPASNQWYAIFLFTQYEILVKLGLVKDPSNVTKNPSDGKSFVQILKNLKNFFTSNPPLQIFIKIITRIPVMLIIFLILIPLLSVTFPILAIFIYVFIPYPSSELIWVTFLLTAVCIYLSSYPLLWFTYISTQLSRNVDTITQIRIFLYALPSHIIFALFLAMFFLFSGFSENPSAPESINISVAQINNPLLIGIILGYFILVVSVPFYIGDYRSRAWKVQLLKKRLYWINNLIDILVTPSGERYEQKIAALRAYTDNENKNCFQNEYPVVLAKKLNQQQETINDFDFRAQLPNSIRDIIIIKNFITDKNRRKSDPRLSYLDWLEDFSAELKNIFDHLSPIPSNADQQKAAELWNLKIQMQKEEVIQQISEIQNSKSIGVNVAIGIIVIVVTTILGKMSEDIWTLIPK